MRPSGWQRPLQGARASGLLLGVLLGAAVFDVQAAAGDTAAPATPDWLARPMSLVQAIDTALERNTALLQARSDLEAVHGVVVQTRAIALPKLRAFGTYQWTDQLEEMQLPTGQTLSLTKEDQWSAGIQIVQSVFEGGRIRSSLRSAKLLRSQAGSRYQVAVADTVLQVRVAYYDILLAGQQIAVQQESLQLLREELANATRRFEAGTVPKFNVLRAEVEVANAQPALIRAENARRIAQNVLANLLGYRLPADVWSEIPLQLTDRLEVDPAPAVDLPRALSLAFAQRPELAALRTSHALSAEEVKSARAGYYPSVQVFAGHGWRSAVFDDDLSTDIAGWNAGAQLNWYPFDGLATAGKVKEARARRESAQYALEDTTRRVELDVRTAHSTLVEAEQVLKSQQKVQEQAEEALRLASARSDAGAGIQLEVLSARTALTQARTTQIQARHGYLVALARLQRAMGLDTAAPEPANR